MSGPKRGRYYIYYDPTPRRLADLRSFFGRLDRWLERNAGFLRRHLGEGAVAEAQEARDRVRSFLAQGDPDGGFDAYGSAWATFNRLWSEAKEARDVDRLLREQRRRQERERRRQEVEVQAAEAIEECRALWADPGNQELLSHWIPARKRESLQAALQSLVSTPPRRALERSVAWRRQFQKLLDSASRAAKADAERLAQLLPVARQDLVALADLNLEVLPEGERERVAEERAGLVQSLDKAMAGGPSATVEALHQRIQIFLSETQAALHEAQRRWEAQQWRDALAEAGFAVKERPDADGKVVLEAHAFPTKKVTVRLVEGSDEVLFHVSPERDPKACIGIVAAIRRALAKRGIGLEMTDMGRANPGAASRLVGMTPQKVEVKR